MERSRGPRSHGRVREAAAPRYSADTTTGVVGVLYDSDVIIEILRGNEDVVGAAASLEASGIPTYVTAIAAAEVYAGIRPGEEPLTQAFFDARGEVVLDSLVGRRAGAYLARHARSDGVEIADALVAAAASTSGLLLWTRNRRHYPMADVRLHDPGPPAPS